MLALLLILQATTGDIVVTGKRLVEAHAACTKGGCTPLRDAQATIALAESRFREGAYLDAKRLLANAVERNKDKAGTDPKPVAALYEAYATVALHDGDERTYRSAVARQVRTLRDNLPASDPSVVSSTTALGDMWMKLGNFHQADLAYRSVEQEALANGQDHAAMLAGMKRVWLASAMLRTTAALSKLRELEERPLARQQGFGTALRVLRLRMRARDSSDQEMQELAGLVAQGQGTDPILIWSPPYEPDAAASASQARALARQFGEEDPLRIRSSDVSAIQWADMGFWIRPDGRTAEIEVLRSSPGVPWAASVLKQISRRRYSSQEPSSSDQAQGVYKIQRFTLRSEYVVPSGSLISRHVSVGGYEILDLTSSAQAAGAATS